MSLTWFGGSEIKFLVTKLKVGIIRGDSSLCLVPATSHGDKSHRVNWPILLRWDQTLVPD